MSSTSTSSPPRSIDNAFAAVALEHAAQLELLVEYAEHLRVLWEWKRRSTVANNREMLELDQTITIARATIAEYRTSFPPPPR